MELRLRDYMAADDGWGHEEGHRLYKKLLDIVERNPDEVIFRLSLKGVSRTDTSFPRESVVELARRFRGQKGFCLTDVSNEDLIDNWDAAALKREQPLFVWTATGYRLLGPAPSHGTREVLDYVLQMGTVTSAQVAEALGLKVPNASNKLKELWTSGYILRREDVSPSGGIEYRYFRIA